VFRAVRVQSACNNIRLVGRARLLVQFAYNEHHAPALPENNVKPVLLEALRFLGQTVSDEWQDLSLDALLEQAVKSWSLSTLSSF